MALAMPRTACSRARIRALRTRLPGDAGFSLIEVLVAAVAAIVVLSAVFALLESSQLVQARDSEWAVTLQEDRAGLARMVRDIRQATEIVEPTTGAASSYITFRATIGGTEWKVEYECAAPQAGTSYSECVRFAAEVGKSFPAKGSRVAIDVANGASVFTYSPSARQEARLVTAKLELPAKGALKQAGSTGYGHKVVLEDAAFMRNRYPEG